MTKNNARFTTEGDFCKSQCHRGKAELSDAALQMKGYTAFPPTTKRRNYLLIKTRDGLPPVPSCRAEPFPVFFRNGATTPKNASFCRSVPIYAVFCRYSVNGTAFFLSSERTRHRGLSKPLNTTLKVTQFHRVL